MNLTVFAGPDPEANLDALLKRTPLRLGPVCAVVPDSRSVVKLERKLARFSGKGFAGHRVHTMEGLALAILSKAGISREIVTRQVKRALAGEAAARRMGRNSRYAPIAGYPGFINAVLTYLADIRSSGKPFSGTGELAGVAEAYDMHLKRLGAVDHEGAVMMALEDGRAELFAREFKGALIVHGFYDLTDRQYQLLALLMNYFGRCAVSIPYDPSRPELFTLPGRLVSRLEASGGKIVNVEPRFEGGTGIVLRGFRGGTYTGEGAPEDVQIHTFRSESSEAGWIGDTIREKIAAGLWEPHEIIIVSRFGPVCGSPLHRALKRNEIPVEGGVRRQLATHPVARVVLDAVEYSIHPENDGLAERVLSSKYTGERKRKAGKKGAPEMDDRGWSCILADTDSPDGFVSSVKKMIEWLDIPKHLDGGGDASGALSEIKAFSRLAELLDEFAAFYSTFLKMVKVSELYRLFLSFLRDAFFIEQPCEGEGVILADVNHARYISRRIVFFAGLDNMPLTARNNGFTLHTPDFAGEIRRHAESEESLLFYLSIHGARQLFLTFPRIESGGGDSSISPYIREIREHALWSMNSFHPRNSGETGLEGVCFDARGRSEQILRTMKADPELSVGILAGLLRDDKTEADRIIHSLERWIGMQDNRGLTLEGSVLLKTAAGELEKKTVYSVSELEQYASCPVRYFLARVVRLKVKRELFDEVDTSSRGIFIHELLARFYRQMISQGYEKFGRIDSDSMKRMMGDICEKLFVEQAELFAGIHPLVIMAEKKFILAWMENYLEHEAENFAASPFRPAFLEADFGIEGHSARSSYPALRIGNESGDVSVSGRIDRIDVDTGAEPPRIRIIDYKTGDYKAYNSDLVSGRALQAPLYLKAAAEHIVDGGMIHESIFYSLREMEYVRYKDGRNPIEGESWEDYIENAFACVRVMAEKIKRGEFPAGDCRDAGRCDFRLLCRGGRETAPGEGEDADS